MAMRNDIQSLIVKTGRQDWVDMLRALAMFFVVLVHASMGLSNWWIYNVFIGPIMLPLFFAISGYLFNYRNGDAKAFYKNLVKKLILPWFGVSLIWLRFLLIPKTGLGEWLRYCWSVLSGDALWFLPALIIAEILFFYILKISKQIIWICIAVAICTILGFLMNHFQLGNVAMLNRAFIAQSFLLIGYLFKCFRHKLEKLDGRLVFVWTILCYLTLGAISMWLFPEKYVDVHLNMYQSIPICFMMSYIGCFGLFITISRVRSVPKFISFLGQNTLVCYAFHMYAFRAVMKVFSVLGINIHQSWSWAIAKTCLAIIICMMISYVLNFIMTNVKNRKFMK